MVDKNMSLAPAQPVPGSTSRWSSMWERYNSVIIWLLLVAYLFVAAYMVTVVFPVQFLDRTQSGFFEAQGIIAIGVMGLIGVWISMFTGFPQAWDSKITIRQRILLPTAAGILFGALFVTTDLVTGMSQLQQEKFNMAATDIPFPGSLFVYPAGAIYLEVVFRLFLIPVLLGLASIFIRRPTSRERTFWVLAVLTSLIEPVSQSPSTGVLPPLAFAFMLAQTFGFNLLQAGYFRKYGYLASIVARIASYIPIHIIGAFLK